MLEIAVRQAILHALIAVVFTEALLRAWGIGRAESRLRFWLLALAFPFLVLPLFLALVPARSTDWFAAGRALFSSDRWSAVRVAAVPVDEVVFGGLAAVGVLLFLRDAVPFVVGAIRERNAETMSDAGAPADDTLAGLVSHLAVAAGTAVPSVRVLRTDGSVLLVRGVWRHTLVLSDGVLARLSADELRASIVHELAHARYRDPLAGWMLMAARLLMFWNPAVQLVSRAIVQEMEHRADALAVETVAAPALVGALRTLSGRGPDLAPSRTAIELVTDRFHREHISARIGAVLAPHRSVAFERTRLALTGAALAVLLFFCV